MNTKCAMGALVAVFAVTSAVGCHSGEGPATPHAVKQDVKAGADKAAEGLEKAGDKVEEATDKVEQKVDQDGNAPPPNK